MEDDNLTELEMLIIECVAAKGGLKGPALVADVIQAAHARQMHVGNNVPSIVYGLAQKGRIVEVEYELPNTGKVKSIFFPAGTTVRGK